MEIILLRHGKPELDLKGRLNASEIKQLIVAYNQSGVQDHPSETLIKRFNKHHVVCSNLNRSIQSAKRLGFKKAILSTPISRYSFS